MPIPTNAYTYTDNLQIKLNPKKDYIDFVRSYHQTVKWLITSTRQKGKWHLKRLVSVMLFIYLHDDHLQIKSINLICTS